MNTTDYLLQSKQKQHAAIIDKNIVYTYEQLKNACDRIAVELHSRGIQPMDHVGLLGKNSFFWVASYLAILKIGAVVVPFPTITTSEDLSKTRRFLSCKAICVDRGSYRKFLETFVDNPNLILEDVLEATSSIKGGGPSLDIDFNQDAALMLTSGTTAVPRAVRITHGNIQTNTNSIIQYLELTHQERMLTILPFYYCFGTSLLHTHLRVGGTLVICNTFAYPETALDMIDDYDVTGFAGVPSTFQTLLRNTTLPQRYCKTLRKVQQAGGKLQTILIKELMAALPESQIYVMYGQTEATARLSYLPPDLLKTKLGSVGKGIPGVTLQVLDEKNNPVKPGEVGEIVARGDNISPGYWNDEVSSAEKFRSGSLHTGDLATVDEDGYIYIVDRKSDFIKSYGYRVSSQEIEARILEIPEVVNAAAIGEPDLVQGEAIKVFITLRKSATLSPEEILTYCRENMVRHMVPKEIVILDRLPTNAHGKIVKAALRREPNMKIT